MSTLFLCLAQTLQAGSPEEADPHAEHRRIAQQTSAMKGAETQVTLPELSLIDGSGKSRDLNRLMNSRKVVIVDFIFTTCTTICPALTAIMSNTKSQLSAAEKENILFISISVDPKNDTPEKMLSYSQRAKAGANWVWLTGQPADISRTLRAFGVPANGRPEDHPPTVLVGSLSQNRWFRWVGMPEPKALVTTARNLSLNTSSIKKDEHAHH